MRYSAIALGASTWFYILYKAKNDGPVLLVIAFPFPSPITLGMFFYLAYLMDANCRDGDTRGIMDMVTRMSDMWTRIRRHTRMVRVP